MNTRRQSPFARNLCRFALGLLLGVFLGPVQALERPGQNKKHWPEPGQVTNLPTTVESPTPAPAPTPDRPFTNDPTAGGMSVDGISEGHVLDAETALTITFPFEVVPADKIDAYDAESPVVADPALDVRFSWQTQSQGTLSVDGPLIPAQKYHFQLRPGLAGLAAEPLPIDAWGVELETPPFDVEGDFSKRSSLNSLPQVRLEFNYPVRLSDAATGIWFQNRVTRQRIAAEILLNVPDGEIRDERVVDSKLDPEEQILALRVRPVSPLPVGQYFDLVVDGVRDAVGGRTTRYPRVFALGTTRPLELSYVAARNDPFGDPCIEIQFTQPLDASPVPPGSVTIEPAVPDMNVTKDGSGLRVEGGFDLSRRYAVTVSGALTGFSGYGLAKAEKWGATFRAKQAAVFFPDRQLRLRSALGFRFAFEQVNTGPLEWKLAPIPLDQLPAAARRLMEFTATATDASGNDIWTPEGLLQQEPTEPLLPALGLQPIATGTVPAVQGEAATIRQISWQPAPGSPPLSGPALFEVTGTDSKGRLVGNRAIVYFGESALTRKTTPDNTHIRSARMSDGQPEPGIAIRAYDKNLVEIASASTDKDGVATFPGLIVTAAEYFGSNSTLQPLSLSNSFSSGSSYYRPNPVLRTATFTDRPLYRPGQEVHFKGIVRRLVNDLLTVPAGKIRWAITPSSGGAEVASGTMKLDDSGAWNGAWTPPEDAPIGYFTLRSQLDGADLENPISFQIEEFRNPPFSVECEGAGIAKPAESVVTVSSAYFHGAPNAGARVAWTATWLSDSEDGYYYSEDNFTRVNLVSENAHKPSYMAEVSGEAALDGNGRVTLRSSAPFPDPGNRANCTVNWKVDVTGPDGQTITGGAAQTVPMDAVLLGIHTKDAKPGSVEFNWDAQEPFGKAPSFVQASLYHVSTKTAKERVAPNVYRYRNFDEFQLVEKRDRVTDPTISFSPKEPGRYVLVVSPPPGQPGFTVSDSAWLTGPGDAEVPVESDTAAQVFTLDSSKSSDEPWLVGETAVLNVAAPSGGIAWVTVEGDKILDTYTVPLPGNASRIEIPIKAEYEPNVFVSVYLLRPGGSDSLAGEMFGYRQIAVRAASRMLDVAVATARPEYEPRGKISGTVTVTSGGAPQPGADLAIYAVDDAILTLGGWTPPILYPAFFPGRTFAIITWSALRDYVDGIKPSWLNQKGFTVGGGGEDAFGNVSFVRKEFKPLILWQPSARTDARGVAKFSCEAPDNLTRFRVVAVAQTKASQFGANSSTFNVTKNLLIDPALPRFLREGDEVELRAVARQKLADSDTLAVSCSATGPLVLSDTAVVRVEAAKDAPTVVRFRARATGTGPATIRFQVASTADPKRTDAVEVTIPISEPVILRRESVAGPLEAREFSPAAVEPDAWKSGRGTFDISVSTTPWLNKLLGLPYLLDYPHGCFEQKTSRLLALTYLSGLLESLPNPGARKANYAAVILPTLEEIQSALLPGGMVPYWPGGTTPNTFVTIQTAWCLSAAEAAGIDVPEDLATQVTEALESMIARKSGVPATERAFALFVRSLGEPDESLAVAANDLYLERDRLTGEGRALLAIALHRLKAEPAKQKTLISELPQVFERITFNPENFSSATRTEALCAWARLLVNPDADAPNLRARLERLMESSSSLSTQENLWLLVAFEALRNATPVEKLKSPKPTPDAVSGDKTAVAWLNRELSALAAFTIRGTSPGGSYVVSTKYRSGSITTPLETRGMRIERIVKNLTDPARTGAEGAPFKLGDQILISYRFNSDKPQSYVAVEDLLPAGLEVVNPNLALFGKFYAIPQEPGVEEAWLSHSALRDQQVNLYFNSLPAAPAGYAVLARATAAGSFIWPATQIQPMYDSRFLGRSPSSVLVVKAD